MDSNLETQKQGKLVLCPTPIGNLEDITYRALQQLRQADLIAAEDTRHTLKLLNHFEIKVPQTSYHEHNKHSKGPELIATIQAGKTVVLVTDAGTPGISDPGQELVSLAVTAGIPIISLPGACAAITGLIASGLNTDRFSFYGFLGHNKAQRQAKIDELSKEEHTAILYEAPHRIRQLLKELTPTMGDRLACLARELTKKHEEFLRGTIRELAQHFERVEPKGEMVLILAGGTGQIVREIETQKSDEEVLRELIDQGFSIKDAAREAAKLTGKGRRELYNLALALVER